MDPLIRSALWVQRQVARATGVLNLTEHVLPPVPLRQWVFTLPHPLRARLGYDAPLLGAVTRLFVDSILGWYQRHLRTSTREPAQSGAAGPDGTPEFRALPRLSTTDVADALQVARARILRYLEGRGVITLDSDADSDVLCLSEELAERDPALAQLAAAAVSGLAPAGPGRPRGPAQIHLASAAGERAAPTRSRWSGAHRAEEAVQ